MLLRILGYQDIQLDDFSDRMCCIILEGKDGRSVQINFDLGSDHVDYPNLQVTAWGKKPISRTGERIRWKAKLLPDYVDKKHKDQPVKNHSKFRQSVTDPRTGKKVRGILIEPDGYRVAGCVERFEKTLEGLDKAIQLKSSQVSV